MLLFKPVMLELLSVYSGVYGSLIGVFFFDFEEKLLALCEGVVMGSLGEIMRRSRLALSLAILKSSLT